MPPPENKDVEREDLESKKEREREDRAATEKIEKWSGAGQVPKMNSLGADRVHISQYARKQMQYRRNTRRIAYLARGMNGDDRQFPECT